jgi:(E)-4-hydroxy-3-methylbut-2-enyl-diphosphate synthase
MGYFNYNRRPSTSVRVGTIEIGGDCPIRIQSMANVSTMATEAAVAQAIRMIQAGAELVRFAVRNEQEARNLGVIRQRLREAGYDTPLVADVHFNPDIADVAATQVEKVRINPGNYARTEEEQRRRMMALIGLCRQYGAALRIGVNHGSLSARIMDAYGDTPEGMVASCMEFLYICREANFGDIVLSIKASNSVVMVQTVRLLVRTMEVEGMAFPLHLGVTEAGDGEDGRIKSAVGIGALLADGIGDTIRVSLSESPEAEIPVARKLLEHIRRRERHESIQASLAEGYDPLRPMRRISRPVGDIGGGRPPVVLPADSSSYPSDIHFVPLTLSDLTAERIQDLTGDPYAVALLGSRHINPVGELRAAMHRLLDTHCPIPVLFRIDYDEPDSEAFLIQTAADLGALFLDGFGDGIIAPRNLSDAPATLVSTPLSVPPPLRGLVTSSLAATSGAVHSLSEDIAYGILQAVRLRISKTEYIACPSCGRTLFDLPTTLANVRRATSHLKGLKIAVMGCIVNGPGEMADADYGYVGAAPHKVNLYKGKRCILRNIPEEEAAPQLLSLIHEDHPHLTTT